LCSQTWLFPISVGLNWNPSYSYAHIPDGMLNVPSYWRKLAEPVSFERGLPHLRDLRISDVRAKGAKQAFEISAYANDPILNFEFDNVDIQAKTAGTIADAENWQFRDTVIRTEDGSRVALKNCKNIRGLPERSSQ
jgi:hypothetical protein